MASFIFNVTFDAQQPRELAQFWSQVLGYQVLVEDDDSVVLAAPDKRGVRQLVFYRVEDPTPGKNRMHVDLASREPTAEIERLVQLGASLVDDPADGRPIWREGNGTRWVVLQDPEGNEFCIG